MMTLITRLTAAFFLSITLNTTTYAAPNILLVIADDMGLDASPCHDVGDLAANMPTLRGLCSSGMVFDNAYTPPSCSPTRATIMTGKYGFRTGIGSAISGKRNPIQLNPSEISIFDVFTRQLPHYSTALIGKWHLSTVKKGLNHPAELGVPYYFGLFAGITKNYYKWTAVENGRRQKVNGYATTVLTDRAISWINDQSKPWFLWLAYNAPHTPYHAPPNALHSYSSVKQGSTPRKSQYRTHYNAALQALDSELGRLLQSMPATKRRNTVVIFVGDNGTPGAVMDRIYAHRGAKATVFEGGVNVPMVVAGPGIARGRSKQLVTTTDLYATITGLAGTLTASKDSVNIINALRGGASGRDYVYSEHFVSRIKKKGSVYGWAIRDQRYKLVHTEDGTEMLFDLSADRFEQRNLMQSNLPPHLSTAYDKLLAEFKRIRRK